jgi:hypothetical protein
MITIFLWVYVPIVVYFTLLNTVTYRMSILESFVGVVSCQILFMFLLIHLILKGIMHYIGTKL